MISTQTMGVIGECLEYFCVSDITYCRLCCCAPFTFALKLVSSISSLAVWICYWMQVEATMPLNMSPFRGECMRASWSLGTALSTLFRSLRLTMVGSLSSSLSQVTNMMVCTSVLDVLYHIVGFLCKITFHVLLAICKLLSKKVAH